MKSIFTQMGPGAPAHHDSPRPGRTHTLPEGAELQRGVRVQGESVKRGVLTWPQPMILASSRFAYPVTYPECSSASTRAKPLQRPQEVPKSLTWNPKILALEGILQQDCLFSCPSSTRGHHSLVSSKGPNVHTGGLYNWTRDE